MFRRTVQGCWLPTPFGFFPFTSPPVRHRVPSRSERPIHLQDQSLSQHPQTYNHLSRTKIRRTTLALTLSAAKSGLTFSGALENSVFIA